ncbi:hypothetical protein FD755_008454 [Muntiacus reevesi]|uniref:Uncharacterized protein n=1 Tax=Muntiacus reevesi TaxID=9886 RepID=A0A5J5MKG9_MUNRE|nr:hypothetical protein FD755_008454 [Muntiacus reevesi]
MAFWRPLLPYLIKVRLRSTYWVSSRDAWAQLPLGMWDLRSATRYQTRVPGIGKQILKHWMTRELPLREHLFCEPMDCNPPGFSTHGISQARILEWVLCMSDELWEQIVRSSCDHITPDMQALAQDMGWRQMYFTNKLQLQRHLRKRKQRQGSQRSSQP